jgi:hypothetical protein
MHQWWKVDGERQRGRWKIQFLRPSDDRVEWQMDEVHSLCIFSYVLCKCLDLFGVIKEERDVILEMELDKEC